jgi:hypothetical protein
MPFRWRPETGFADLDEYGVAADVSADGAILIGALGYGRAEGFRWDASDGFRWLRHPSGVWRGGSAAGLSPDGSIIVGGSEGPEHVEAVVWTSEGPTALPTPVGFRSWANAVSARGTIVVGGFYSDSADSEAAIWGGSSLGRNLRELLAEVGLDLSGWTLEEATDVSDDGRTIVGYGQNPEGLTEAWLARLPPACGDRLDNDRDGSMDSEDPGCIHPGSDQEDPACNDGVDNDLDGLIDANDPHCANAPWRDAETAFLRHCGVGFELAVALVVVASGRRRRR